MRCGERWADWRNAVRLGTVFPLAFGAMLAISAGPSRADEFSPAQKKAIEGIVHDYVLQHPEVLIEAVQAADDKMKADAHDKASKVLGERRKDIFDDPTSPVAGNAHGDVTMVEFFDYRCPYCKQVEPALEKVIAGDQKLRFVYKEFPVLGPASKTAARAALAAKKQGKYDAFHRAMMAAKGNINDDAVYGVAGSVGLDVAQLKRDMAAPEIDKTLKDNYDLADALAINGTPAFVVGNQIIPGAVDVDDLKQAIADARKK
ncbi:MAG TPA: DsbA family protein [Stellaceae bacterium]|jgi:protein-disulfide isomerase|nr:DsbA family protein [Stellaceae bacterium]